MNSVKVKVLVVVYILNNMKFYVLFNKVLVFGCVLKKLGFDFIMYVLNLM